MYFKPERTAVRLTAVLLAFLIPAFILCGCRYSAEEKKITVSITGDIMLARGVQDYTDTYGYDYPYEYVKEIFQNDDLTIANLECVLSDNASSAYKGKSFVFKAAAENAEAMKKAGIDCVSLANNHSYDYYGEGLEDTVECLKKSGIGYVGICRGRSAWDDSVQDSYAWSDRAGDNVLWNSSAWDNTFEQCERGKTANGTVYEISGIKLGVLAYCMIMPESDDIYAEDMVQKTASTDEKDIIQEEKAVSDKKDDKSQPALENKNDRLIGLKAAAADNVKQETADESQIQPLYLGSEDFDKMKSDIEQLECDFIIVYFHWGKEYVNRIQEVQVEAAKAAIDAGADFVAGTHPHVIQSSEEYEGHKIYYSLGNFIFDNQYLPGTDEALVLQLVIDEDRLQEVKELKYSIKHGRPE